MMTRENIGILHPGEMGCTVGASAAMTGNAVFWYSKDRSQRTRDRAAAVGLHEIANYSEFCNQCDIVVSVCPPQNCMTIAEELSQSHFNGVFVEANAVSPMKVQQMAALFADRPVEFVDGGLVGPPVRKEGTTVLYLSGKAARQVAELFACSPLGTYVIDSTIGNASALKMCFAAYTKGSAALTASILSVADGFGINEALNHAWGIEAVEERMKNIQRIAGRAWRWEPEMHEIADTLASRSLPDGFHRAAAELFKRMSEFKDCEHEPDWSLIVQAIDQQR